MLSSKGWYGLGRTVAASKIDSQVSQIDYNWTASLTGGGGGGGGCLQIFSCLKLEQQIAETTVDKGNCCTAEKCWQTNNTCVCVRLQLPIISESILIIEEKMLPPQWPYLFIFTFFAVYWQCVEAKAACRRLIMQIETDINGKTNVWEMHFYSCHTAASLKVNLCWTNKEKMCIFARKKFKLNKLTNNADLHGNKETVKTN